MKRVIALQGQPFPVDRCIECGYFRVVVIYLLTACTSQDAVPDDSKTYWIIQTHLATLSELIFVD
jgi:hypothetical protein